MLPFYRPNIWITLKMGIFFVSSECTPQKRSNLLLKLTTASTIYCDSLQNKKKSTNYNSTMWIIFQVYGRLKSIEVSIRPKSPMRQLAKSSKNIKMLDLHKVILLSFSVQKRWFVTLVWKRGRNRNFSFLSSTRNKMRLYFETSFKSMKKWFLAS